MESKYMTIEEVAKQFQVSERTVSTWIKTKGFPVIRLGNLIRFDSDMIKEWVDKQVKTGGQNDKKNSYI